MKIAAAYIRVSTDDQIEFSPDSQIKALKNYAEKNNILLPEQYIFKDEGISGKTTAKRPEFNRMIAISKTIPKPFDVILVWKYSRFARNREDSIVFKSMLRKELGIDVVSISENVGDDKMSIIFEAMIEAMDEYYSINLAEEVKRGMTEKAKRGGVLSIAPFGYAIKDGVFVPVPEEAQIIKKVFNDYLKGDGFLKIAKSINALGIKTHRGNRIESRTVEYWLNNPVYIGKHRWNPCRHTDRHYNDKNLIISNGLHDALIDMDTWNFVRERLKKQKLKFARHYSADDDLSHWCVGIARCGICGATLSNAKGYLSCSKRGKGICDGNGSISISVLEKIIIEALKNILYDSDADIKIIPKKDNAYINEYEILKSELKRIKLKLERVKTAYKAGIDTIEEYKYNKITIQNEIACINEKLNNFKPEEDTSSEHIVVQRLIDILGDSTVKNSQKNNLLKIVLKEIVKMGENGNILKFVFRL